MDPDEVLVPNTTTGDWELLEFEFAATVGNTSTRLVFFPDFPEIRSAGLPVLIDNISWPGGGIAIGVNRMVDINLYPNPATERITVLFPGTNSVKISNFMGQTVKSFDYQGSN